MVHAHLHAAEILKAEKDHFFPFVILTTATFEITWVNGLRAEVGKLTGSRTMMCRAAVNVLCSRRVLLPVADFVAVLTACRSDKHALELALAVPSGRKQDDIPWMVAGELDMSRWRARDAWI